MTIIDPLTVVNSTSCYSVDSVDSCSFIETPEVFEISRDLANISVDRYSVDSRTSSKSSLWMPRRVIYGFANLIIWQRATFTQIFYKIFAYTAKVDREDLTQILRSFRGVYQNPCNKCNRAGCGSPNRAFCASWRCILSKCYSKTWLSRLAYPQTILIHFR